MLMPFAFQQSGAVVFDPAAISGLTHRYSASGAASGLSGSFVTSWTDSVSGVNMVQATAGRQPTYIASAYDFNGQPVVRFSAGRVMASASLSSVFGSASRTVFVIAKTNAIGDVTYGDNLFATDDAPISQYNANTWPYYLPKAISTRGIHGWASASSFYGEQPVSKPITIVWRHNSGTTTFRREQTTLINAAFSVSGNQGYCVVGKGMQNTGHDSDCDISEILVYNRALSDAEITQVENYAIAKYNLGSYGTLPVASPALWLDASRSDTLFTDNALTTAVTTDNGPVGGWKDLSGNNRHATQGTTGSRPTWRTPINGQNGLGAMSFNGSSGFLSVADSVALQFGTGDFTALVVAAVANASRGSTQQNTVFSKGFANLEFSQYEGWLWAYLGGTNNSPNSGVASVASATPFASHFKRESGSSVVGVNGAVGSMVTNTTNTSGAGTSVFIGSRNPTNAASYLAGSIFEVVLIPRAITPTELSSWYAYSRAKWGTP